MATDRDIIFAIVCTDVMNKRTNIRTHIMQYNSNCKTRCIISTSKYEIFPCMRIIKRDTFVCFESFFVAASLRSLLSTGNHGESMKQMRTQKTISLVLCLFRETPIRKDKKRSCYIWYYRICKFKSIEKYMHFFQIYIYI